MAIEVVRLLFGVFIVLFHRPIADFILRQEEALIANFRRRGLLMPLLFTREGARNLYFGLGVFIAVVEMARIWFILP
jgi:hypothetical protein